MLRIERPGVPHRHRAPAQRQRGLVLRPRADLRRRRRDGRRPGRRGRLQSGRRRLRPRPARRPARAGPARDDRDGEPRRSTSSPAPTPRWPGWGRRSPRRSSTPTREEVAIGHVGDSRAYRLRGGRLERLTRDHSLVEEMRRKGQLTDAQAEDHPQRSIITRALGPEPEVEVDVQTVPAAARRRLPALLRRADDDARRRAQIGRCSRGATSMSAAVRALVDEANRAGGRDNITALAFRLEDAAAPQRQPPRARHWSAPSAEEAGLTATEVRRRAAAAAARERREQLEAKAEAPPPAHRAPRSSAALVVVAALAFGAWYGNRQVWFLGTDDGRPRRPLSRPALRTSLRHRALRRALREPDPDRLAAAASAATRSPATTCARAATRSR